MFVQTQLANIITGTIGTSRKVNAFQFMLRSLLCRIDAKSFVPKINAKSAPITSCGGIPIITRDGSNKGAPPRPESPIATPTIKPMRNQSNRKGRIRNYLIWI